MYEGVWEQVEEEQLRWVLGQQVMVLQEVVVVQGGYGSTGAGMGNARLMMVAILWMVLVVSEPKVRQEAAG